MFHSDLQSRPSAPGTAEATGALTTPANAKAAMPPRSAQALTADPVIVAIEMVAVVLRRERDVPVTRILAAEQFTNGVKPVWASDVAAAPGAIAPLAEAINSVREINAVPRMPCGSPIRSED